MNTWMKDMHRVRARYMGEVEDFMPSSDMPLSLASPHVHQPRSSWNPVFWGFLHQDGVVDHYLYSQPFSPLKRVGSRMKNSQLLIMAWPLE